APMLIAANVPAVEDMSIWRRSNAQVLAALGEAKPALEAKRAEIIEKRLDEFRRANPGKDGGTLIHTIRQAMEGCELHSEFVVYTPEGKALTVGELLADPVRYDGIELRDPLEPGYDGGRQVAKAYPMQQRPMIHSQAHGGRDFELAYPRADIDLTR